jgi:hypothetical protein
MKRPSPALVVALLALIVALGGTGYAAAKLPKNSVGSKQVKDSSLKAKDIAPGAIGEKSITPGAIGAKSIAPGVIGEKSNVYYGIARAQKTIIGQVGVDTPYVTLSALPAGTYLLIAHLTLVKFDAPDTIARCGIKAAGADSAAGGDGNGSAAGLGPANASVVVPLTTSLTVTSPSTFDAQLYCWQDGTNVKMEEGRLIAQRVDSISVSGGP